VYQPIYGTMADGYSVEASSPSSATSTGILARASTFFPGATFGNPNSLICQLKCGAVPAPPFPLTVQTTGTPKTVSQQTSTPVGGAGQPASGQAASADASASLPSDNPGAGVSTQAVVTGMDFPGAASGAPTAAAAPNPAVVSVGSAIASTFQHFDQHGVLVTTSDAHLSGISLLAGQIRISSIDATSTASGNGAQVHTHSDHVTMGAVTVAGMPATIGSDGITITGQGTGSGPINALNIALQQALAAAGMQVSFSGPTSKPLLPIDGCTGSQADGLNITVAPPGQTQKALYTLGSSCASVQAGVPATGSSGQTTLPSVTGSSGSSAPLAAGSAAAPESAPAPSGSTGNSGAPAAPAPAAPTAAPTPKPAPGPVTAAAGGPLTSHHVWTLYLAVVLALAAVLVGAGVQLRPLPRRIRPPGAGPPS